MWIMCSLGNLLGQGTQVCGEGQSEFSWLPTLPMLEKQRSSKPHVPISPACSLAWRPCVLLPVQTMGFGLCWSLDSSLNVSRPCGFKVREALAP